MAVGEAPLIRPLAEVGPATRWAVLLVNRRHGRLFSGTRWALAEAGDVYDREADRTRAGVRDMPGSGTPDELLHAAGIDAEAIASAARALVRGGVPV